MASLKEPAVAILRLTAHQHRRRTTPPRPQPHQAPQRHPDQLSTTLPMPGRAYLRECVDLPWKQRTALWNANIRLGIARRRTNRRDAGDAATACSANHDVSARGSDSGRTHLSPDLASPRTVLSCRGLPESRAKHIPAALLLRPPVAQRVECRSSVHPAAYATPEPSLTTVVVDRPAEFVNEHQPRAAPLGFFARIPGYRR